MLLEGNGNLISVISKSFETKTILSFFILMKSVVRDIFTYNNYYVFMKNFFLVYNSTYQKAHALLLFKLIK